MRDRLVPRAGQRNFAKRYTGFLSDKNEWNGNAIYNNVSIYTIDFKVVASPIPFQKYEGIKQKV